MSYKSYLNVAALVVCAALYTTESRADWCQYMVKNAGFQSLPVYGKCQKGVDQYTCQGEPTVNANNTASGYGTWCGDVKANGTTYHGVCCW